MTVEERLERIEEMLSTLVKQQTIKDWYTTAEVGGILGRAEYTVREWCRQGRIRAKKSSADVEVRVLSSALSFRPRHLFIR